MRGGGVARCGTDEVGHRGRDEVWRVRSWFEGDDFAVAPDVDGGAVHAGNSARDAGGTAEGAADGSCEFGRVFVFPFYAGRLSSLDCLRARKLFRFHNRNSRRNNTALSIVERSEKKAKPFIRMTGALRIVTCVLSSMLLLFGCATSRDAGLGNQTTRGTAIVQTSNKVMNTGERNSPDPRYGAWKFIHEIQLADLLENPVWAWCMQLGLPDEDDGPMGGDETSMRPLLGVKDVPLDHRAPPLILLRVRETEFYACGLYDREKKRIEAITVFTSEGSLAPKRVAALPEPVTYVSIPSIGGRREVAFRAKSKNSDEAEEEIGK